ncbi:MAG: glycosyltransferase family 2 protein [Candidatus Omnitrophica bacterium]|nr:glycosyltransferase family 2 protein [Candidatus Omnitrophota bacterium]
MTSSSISIVNYNSRDDLIRCLDTAPDCDIFVVDNASTEPIDDLAEKYKRVNFIFNKKNIGFGAANNIALKKASTGYFLICNPDIRFRKDTVAELTAYMDAHEDVAIAGPKLLNEDGTVQYSCRRFPTPATFFARGLFPGRNPKFMRDYLMTDADRSKPLDVDWVLGSFMFARRDDLVKLGGFDESHFMYYEDIDLCYRVKKVGKRVVYVPQAEATHTYRRESARGGFGKLKYHHTLNAMRFFARRMFA